MNELTGYIAEDSVVAGEKLTIAVDSQGRTFDARLVRLRGPRDDFQSGSPWFSTETVAECAPVEGLQGSQTTNAGSFGHTSPLPSILGDGGASLVLWIWPGMLPQRGNAALVSQQWPAGPGFQVALSPEGHVVLTVEGEEGVGRLVSDRPVATRSWSAIAVSIDAAARRLDLVLAQATATGGLTITSSSAKDAPIPSFPHQNAPVVLAARLVGDGSTHEATDLFDGKIDRPRLWRQALTESELVHAVRDQEVTAPLFAEWGVTRVEEVARGGDQVPDASGHGHHLVLVNRAQVGVTGYRWTGDVLDFRQSPDEYSAIRFHSDDLGDARWDPTFTLETPETLVSGIYAVELSCDNERELIPVYVRPAAGSGRKAEVLYIAPTMTYLAYANDRQHTHAEFGDMTDGRDPGDYEAWIDAHPQFGSSLYDFHPDGDGCSFSARRRPLANVRPGYVSWITGGPRHFSADLAIIAWLEHAGVEFDVATDQDLHRQGASLLAGYKVVVTGSHPEYVSHRMLDALSDYLDGPGHLMYLGGNGFYWVTGVADDGSIEIRRGHAGTRMWESLPGEDVLSLSSEPGGLWRHRGRSPNELVGIGFAAQGWSGSQPYLVSTTLPGDLHDLVFGDLAPGSVIGAFGNSGGAAGDEVDRFDLRFGSPLDTVVLARSQRFNDSYQPVVEDQMTITPGIGGSTNDDVRADMTYLKHAGGGAVFSVGSINWASCLPTDDFENDIAAVSTNVLLAFLSDAL